MIQILYTLLDKPIEKNKFLSYLSLLPDSMQRAVNRYKRKQDADACLVGKLLLLKGLDQMGFGNLSLKDIKYTEYNQPYFQENLKFNISHSGNLVVCALTLDNHIGIDVEHILPIAIDDFDSQFSYDERAIIKRAPDPTREFYQWWTKKEAIVKADGRGLMVPLKDIRFENKSEARIDHKKWFLKSVALHENYCSHIASDRALSSEVRKKELFF